jgi:hypothetical protein
MDNVQDEAFSIGDVARFRSRIKVLNVFKLQNSFLSGKLQVSLIRTLVAWLMISSSLRSNLQSVISYHQRPVLLLSC